jgi:hypothetical protein
MKKGLSLRDDRAARKPCLDIYAGGSLRHPDLLLYPPVVSDVSFDLGHHLYPLGNISYQRKIPGFGFQQDQSQLSGRVRRVLHNDNM